MNTKLNSQNFVIDIKFNPDYRTYEKMVLREPGGEYHTDSELREVYTWMLTNQYFKPFESKPGYEKYRRVLVDWMWEIGDTIKQSFTTIHHSVCIMDIYFSKLDDIESNNRGKRLLKLVALTWIFISATIKNNFMSFVKFIIILAKITVNFEKKTLGDLQQEIFLCLQEENILKQKFYITKEKFWYK